MITAFSIAAGLCALAAIAVERNERRQPAFYVLKPLTTLCIIAVAAVARTESMAYQSAILAGLVLSLAGDVCLMFRGDRWFVAGLVSFLVAHLCFVAGFLWELPRVAPPAYAWASLVWGAALLVVLWPKVGALRAPVAVYGAVLAAMVIAAAARHDALADDASLYALAGAGLFLLSDSLLAVRQFVRPYPLAQPLILSTYWLAIWLIALSV